MRLSKRDIVLLGKALAALLFSLILTIPTGIALAMFMATMMVTIGGWFGTQEQVSSIGFWLVWGHCADHRPHALVPSGLFRIQGKPSYRKV